MAKNNNSDFIDIVGLFRQYVKKWYLFVISVVVCVGLAFIYSKVRLPEYAVRANLLISTDKGDMGAAAAGGMGAISMLFGSDGYVEDEIFIVSSHSLYRDVVKDLGINIEYYTKKNFLTKELAYPEHPLVVTPQAGMLDTLETSIAFNVKVNKNGKTNIKAKMKRKTVAKVNDVTLPYTIKTPRGEFTFAKTSDYPTGEGLSSDIIVAGYDAAAEYLDLEINTEIASKRSNVISLGINTTNPKYGKAVLNEIIAKYNDRGVQEKNHQNQQTAKFIDGRLDILASELNLSEAEVQEYKQKKGMVEFEIDARYNLEKKGRLEADLLNAKTQEEIIKMTLSFLGKPENAYALIPTTLDNEGLQRSIEAYNTVVLQRAELANSARADNTMLKQLSEQLDLMRSNIATSVSRALETAHVAVRDLEREMNSTQAALTDIPAQEREYGNLIRDLKVKQELFIFLLQRREETAMMLATAYPKGVTVDEAYTLSEPLGLTRKMILLIGFFLGIMIPPVILYIRKLVHNRFETRADVERMTDVPILGEMCIDNSGRRLVVSSDDTTATAELFRLMRSNLLFILNDPRDKVVLLTSTSSGEGKSFISINLAASLALLNKRVLLVGMDIRNPQLANYLNIAPQFGLTQYLSSSKVTLEQTIMPYKEIPGLDIICAGPVPPNPAELLISPKVDELFQQLRSMYDYVIVDTAPIGLVSDTFTLDRIADAAIYVCRANYTSLSDLDLINDIYEQHRLKKVSLVINGTAAKKTYGYGKKKSHGQA